MTSDEMWAVIQQHKDYISIPITNGRCDLEKGDKVIVGDRFDLSSRRLTTVKRLTKWTITTECGLVFRGKPGQRDFYAEAEDGQFLYLFDVEVNYRFLHVDLPIDEVKEYLQWLTGCTKFQFGCSHYDWQVSCWAGDRPTGFPARQFIVRKHPVSALADVELARIDKYDRAHFPNHQIVLFEDVKARRVPGER